jgi:hypothetical protein
MQPDLERHAAPAQRDGVVHPETPGRAPADGALGRRRRSPASARKRPPFGATWILPAAMVIFYLLLLRIGPINVVDAMPDLDLGGGISMTPDGQIKVTSDPPVGPMRIPEESEYGGISMP